MEELVTKLAEYGLLGIMLGVAIYFIKRMQEANERERERASERAEKQHDQMVAISKTFQEVTTKQHIQTTEQAVVTNSLISEIKGMLKK